MRTVRPPDPDVSGLITSSGASSPSQASAPAGARDDRVYLSAEQLAARTPWTVDAIEKLVQRGVLTKGRHYFQLGRRTQRIFKWSAIVDLIEGRPAPNGDQPMLDQGRPRTPASSPARRVIDVEKATTDLQRLLD